MTRYVPEEYYATIKQGPILPRDYIWMIARDRLSGAPVGMGVWSDLGPTVAPVIDPVSGGTVNRSFTGAGMSIVVSDIQLQQGITVQRLTIKLLRVDASINDFFRTYDCKQANIQVFRGVLNRDTYRLVAPAVPRFNGFLDSAPIKTPKENEVRNITLTCTSNTQELTRANSDTRSDASQRLRSSTDGFYRDTAVVKDWLLPWGQEAGPIPTVRPR